MIISEKNNYIYMAVPKTGTTSVQKFLLSQDSTASKNSVELNGVKYRFQEHMTAQQIKDVLGNNFEKFIVLGFIRNPFSRLVSSYFFYKKGAKDWLYDSGRKKQSFTAKCRVWLARGIPFHLWALLYPYKSNREYFFDSKGNLIVEHVGIFEHLNEDLKIIFEKLNLDFDVEKLPHSNVSKHDETEKYFQKNSYVRLLKIRHPEFKADIDFYNKYAQEKVQKTK